MHIFLVFCTIFLFKEYIDILSSNDIIKLVMKMHIIYEKEKINKTLYDFYNSTGITIDLLDAQFNHISHTPYEFNHYCKCIRDVPKGENACKKSDIALLEKCRKSKKTEIHICHAGLVDIAVPINYNEEIIGYMIFGQMKTRHEFPLVESYLKNLGLNISEMKKYYDNIALYNLEKIESISNTASLIIKYILFENMLKPELNTNVQLAVNYINNNLSSELSIKSITKSINISKSVLYKIFREQFDCTISEYINEQRIELAKKLLEKNDLSIEDVSQRVGYTNASYFSKIFKRKEGLSPLKFKKQFGKL